MPVAVRSTSPDLTVVFHPRPDGRYIELKHNLKRKKLFRTNQDSNFFGGTCYSRGMVSKNPNPIRRERQSSFLKDDFSSSTDPYVFMTNPS